MMRPRAREKGVWFGSQPTGPKNMITDVPGVKVGHCTIIRGSGPLKPGHGPVRTGVTAILPHARNVFVEPVKASFCDFNGCGGLVSSLQIREFGLIDTPIILTNTMSMAAASEGVIKWLMKSNPGVGLDDDTIIPTISECDDSYLNDARGLHVREEHVFAAIDGAKDSVEEGAVGAGTGMTCYDFKGGIGTASRVVSIAENKYTVGSLALTNHGEREELRIDGVPIGANIPPPEERRPEKGSIIMVVATDAPLDSRQLGRIAKRAILGLAVTGSASHNGSGDISIAFSTVNTHSRKDNGHLISDTILRDSVIDPLFRATADCVTEAIVNSLFKAETVEGRDGHTSYALPIDKTLELLKEHGRLLRST